MPKARTDPGKEAEVLRLYEEGFSLGAIERSTGISKSTVRKILKRAQSKDTAKDTGENPPRGSSRAPASSKGVRSKDTAKDTAKDTHPPGESPTDALSMITKERSARALLDLLDLAKDGYREAHAATTKTKDGREVPISQSDRTWAEVQYLKLYKDGIKLLIECTGLDKEALESLPSSPVDDWTAEMLDSLREDA